MALLAVGGLMITVASVTSWTWVLRTSQLKLMLFDAEASSPLYCGGPLIEAFRKSALHTRSSCVLRRTDYAAPGRDRDRAPEILCLLHQRIEGDARLVASDEALRCP